MQVGGNANAVRWTWLWWVAIPRVQLLLIVIFSFSSKTAFFRQHGCSTNDTNAKYNSRAAQMYREKIRQLAIAALSKYGTDVSISLLLLWPQPSASVLRVDGVLRNRRLSLLSLWAVKDRPESAGQIDKHRQQRFYQPRFNYKLGTIGGTFPPSGCGRVQFQGWEPKPRSLLFPNREALGTETKPAWLYWFKMVEIVTY